MKSFHTFAHIESMLKKFLKNIALVLFLNLLIKPFWILGIDRSVQNFVGVEDYGFYYSIFSFSFLLNIILDFGITNFNNRNISQNNHLLRKHLSSIIVLKLLLGGVYLLISLLGAFVIGYNFLQIMLLIVLAFNQFLISFVLYLRSNLTGLHLFKIDSFISVLDRSIMIIVCAVLLWGNLPITFSIRWYAFAQLFAYFLTALITLVIVFKKAKSKFLKLNWSLPFSLMIIKKSFPFAILVLLMTFYNRIDTVMIERMLPDASVPGIGLNSGEGQSGIYASAYRLLDATNMIAYLFSVLLLPLFAKMIKHKESVEDLVKLSFSILFAGAVIVSLSSFFYSDELMKLLYPQNIIETDIAYASRMAESSKVFGLLMACFVPISTTYVFGSLLTANGNLKQLNIMAASGMALNILLNIILIPKLFAAGSAFASLSTQLITSLIQVILVQRIFGFRINYKFLLSLLIFATGVVLIGYLTLQLEYQWISRMMIMILASGLLAIILRIISFRKMLGIIRNE